MKINSAYWKLRNLGQRYIVCYGGRRSGKSVAISQLLVLRAYDSKRKIVVLRKVARTIRLSVFPRIESALVEAGLPYTKNKTDLTFTLANGSEILFVGADDPEKLKSLEGATDYWLEEATEFDEEDFDTVDAGLSADVTPDPWIMLSFNPIPLIPGFESWIQRRFLHGEFPIGKIVISGEYAVLRTSYKQNKFCPQKTIDVLEAYKVSNPSLYKMWALGEFTTVEGSILTKWDIVDKVPDGINEGYYGLDFGFSADPACLIKTWIHNDDIYAREDIYQTGLTNQALGKMMQEDGVNGVIIADSAEPKSIAELKEMGFHIKGYEKSPDYKRAAAQWLQGKNIHILRGSTNMVREISSWCWDRDRKGNQLPKPADGNDHTVDSLIYSCYVNKRTASIHRY